MSYLHFCVLQGGWGKMSEYIDNGCTLTLAACTHVFVLYCEPGQVVCCIPPEGGDWLSD